MNINTTKSCYLCKNTFGLLQRKYHCNKCGLIVCQQCFIKKPDRLCKDCSENPNKAVNNRIQRLKDSLDKNDVSTVPRHLSRRASSYTQGLQTYFRPMKRNTLVERDFINRSLVTKSYTKRVYKIHKIKPLNNKRKNNRRIGDEINDSFRFTREEINSDEIDKYYLERLQLENYKRSSGGGKRSSLDSSCQSDRISDLYESRSRFSSVSTAALTPLIVEWIDNPLFDPMNSMKCKVSYTFIKDKSYGNNNSSINNSNNITPNGTISGSGNNNSDLLSGSLSSYRQKQQSQRQRAITECNSYSLTGSLNQSMMLKRSTTQATSSQQQLLLQQQQSQASFKPPSLSSVSNNKNTSSFPIDSTKLSRTITAPLPSTTTSSSTPMMNNPSSNTRIRSGSGCISPKLLSPSHSNKHIKNNINTVSINNNSNRKNTNPWDFLDGTLNPVIASPIHNSKSPITQGQQCPFPPPPFIKRKTSNNSTLNISANNYNTRFRSKTIAIQPDEGKDIYDVGSSSESYKDMFLPNNNRSVSSNGMRMGSKSISLGNSKLNTSSMHHLPPTVQLAMASYMFDSADTSQKHKKARKRTRSSRKTFG